MGFAEGHGRFKLSGGGVADGSRQSGLLAVGMGVKFRGMMPSSVQVILSRIPLSSWPNIFRRGTFLLR